MQNFGQSLWRGILHALVVCPDLQFICHTALSPSKHKVACAASELNTRIEFSSDATQANASCVGRIVIKHQHLEEVGFFSGRYN